METKRKQFGNIQTIGENKKIGKTIENTLTEIGNNENKMKKQGRQGKKTLEFLLLDKCGKNEKMKKTQDSQAHRTHRTRRTGRQDVYNNEKCECDSTKSEI